MSADLQAIIDANSGNVNNGPLSRRQVVPYAALQALNTPSDLNEIANALISTLAILVAQGKDTPVLLSADAQGRLITSAAGNSIAKFAAPFTGGATVAQVVDSSGFYPGQLVSFASATGSGAACGGMTCESVPDSTHIMVFSSCVGQNFVPGDFIIGKSSFALDPTGLVVPVSGSVSITGTPNVAVTNTPNVNVVNAAEVIGLISGVVDIGGSSPPTIPVFVYGTHDNNGVNVLGADVRGWPCGFQAGFNFLAGTTPSMVFAAIPGNALMLQSYRVTVGTTAASGIDELISISEVGAGGNTLWTDSVGIPAVAGTVYGTGETDLKISTRKGFGIQLTCNNALLANQFASVSMCGYII